MRQYRSTVLSQRIAAIVVASSAVLALTQCKKSPTEPIKVAAADLNAPLNSSVAAAAVGKTFTFNGGGAVLAPALTGQTFSATFTSASAVTFATTGGGSASATVAYGSCIFTISISTITGLPSGTTVTIPNCSLTFNTTGHPANGTTSSVNAFLTFGTFFSVPLPTNVTINPDGSVTLPGGGGLGTVTITNGTGAA